jgi:hypothetical protein
VNFQPRRQRLHVVRRSKSAVTHFDQLASNRHRTWILEQNLNRA